jgi:hypothetical protein
LFLVTVSGDVLDYRLIFGVDVGLRIAYFVGVVVVFPKIENLGILCN